MGDYRQHGEKDFATRPKEPRGRGRTARKYTESGQNECSGGRGKSQTLGRATSLSEVHGIAVGQSGGKKQSLGKPQKAQQTQTKINSAPDDDECAQSEVNLSGRTNKNGNKKLLKKRVKGLLVQGSASSSTDSTEEAEDSDGPSQINWQTKQTPSGMRKSSKPKHMADNMKLKMKDISNAAEEINNIGEKDSATRPKEPRGRGRTARKYTESDKIECSGGRGKSRTLGRATSLSEVHGIAVGQSSVKEQSQRKPQKAQQTQTKINPAPDDDECAQSEVNLSGRTNKNNKTGNKKLLKKRVKGLLVQGRASSSTDSTEEAEDSDGPSQINWQTKQTPSGKGKSSKLKHVVASLKLKMKDISNAAVKINNIINTIIHEVSEKDLLFQDIERMTTGSYYEGVKISDPNEFDIMLKIPIRKNSQRFALTEYDKTGAFYTLTCKRSAVDFLKNYTDDDGNILSQKVISKFRKYIKDVISGMPVTLLRKKPSCPAVTLIIENEPMDISVDLVLALEVKQSWPEKTKDGMNIDEWLGKKVKRGLKFKPFYMVPKQADTGKEAKDTWRISFSHIEKEILLNHGSAKTCCEAEGKKCCRKQCLKLLKYLLEMLGKNGMKGKMDNFCSYHAKTALFHHCTQYTKDEDWKLEDLDECFNRYITFFQECLKKAQLPNFFIPSLNLFSSISTDCTLLYRMLEDQKQQNYPLFYS